MSKFTVTTRLDGPRIIQSVDFTHDISDPDPFMSNVRTQVINTMGEQGRQALIKLGWTPPADETVRRLRFDRIEISQAEDGAMYFFLTFGGRFVAKKRCDPCDFSAGQTMTLVGLTGETEMWS